MENQSTRLFTRADVERHVLECLNGKDKSPLYTVDKICLLKEMPVPTWIAHLTVTWQSPYEHSYPSTSVVFQRAGITEPYLYFAIEAEIPEVLETCADEDAAIKRREDEERAEWLRKQGQDDASASNY